MKILITGGTGFLGTNLLKRLEKDNHEICLFTRDWTESDILDFNPNFIFHFAGEIRDEEKMIGSNLGLTYRLLQIILKLKDFKGMITLGSSSEYGVKRKPMKESDLLNPNHLYGSTKAASTLLCLGFAREHNLPISIIRPFSVYGYYDHNYKFIPTIFSKMIQKEIINVCYGNHDWIFCDDFIDLVIRVFQNIKIGDVINAGTGIQTSNIALVRIFEKLLKQNAELIEVPGFKNFDSVYWVSNSNYAEKVYGWKAKTSLEEGITKYITWRGDK